MAVILRLLEKINQSYFSQWLWFSGDWIPSALQVFFCRETQKFGKKKLREQKGWNNLKRRLFLSVNQNYT